MTKKKIPLDFIKSAFQCLKILLTNEQWSCDESMYMYVILLAEMNFPMTSEIAHNYSKPGNRYKITGLFKDFR